MSYELRTELEILWDLVQFGGLSRKAYLTRLDDLAWEYDLADGEIENLMVLVDSYKW